MAFKIGGEFPAVRLVRDFSPESLKNPEGIQRADKLPHREKFSMLALSLKGARSVQYDVLGVEVPIRIVSDYCKRGGGNDILYYVCRQKSSQTHIGRRS